MEQFGKKARQKRRNLKRRTRGSTTIRLPPLLVDLFLFCRQFISEDPAPTLPSSLLRPSPRSSTSYLDADVSTLTKILLDPSLSLFVRYRALFTLRNIGTPAAIDALSSALLSPNEICSPLFKHEVAFFFGQISDPHSVPALLKVLGRKRRRLLVELARTTSCPCCEGGPLVTTHPGWSGKAVWWRLTCGRYIIRLTSDWAHPY